MVPSYMSTVSGTGEALRAELEQQTCTASHHLAFSGLWDLSMKVEKAIKKSRQ